MFEIIQTRRFCNKTYYQVKTSHSVEWYYIKGAEWKKMNYLRYERNKSYRMLIPLCCFGPEDWEDAKKFIKSLIQ